MIISILKKKNLALCEDHDKANKQEHFTLLHTKKLQVIFAQRETNIMHV